jgi:hypothetical protein
LILPLCPLLCALYQWPAADKLITPYAAEIPYAVGFSSHTSWSQIDRQQGLTKTSSRSRSYILLSSLLHHPAAVTVHQTNDDTPTVNKEDVPMWVFVEIALTYTVGAFVVWWFWFR